MGPQEQALQHLTPGPTVGTLAGYVYVDTDSSGTLDATEAGFGVADITVYVTDPNGVQSAVQTDADGLYQYRGPGGLYTVEVAASTPETDFNEGLFESYDPTSPTSVQVQVTEAGSGLLNNFGFNPQVLELITRLQQGDLLSTGLPVNYWRRQFALVLQQLEPPAMGQPDPPDPDYTAAELIGFLNVVEGLAFEEPFQFPDGQELKTALLILSNNSGFILDELLKELLAFEINHAAGKGLINDIPLQLTLVNYAESVYITEGGLNPSPNRVVLAPALSEEDATTTKLMLEEANRGGGGGPVQ